MHKDPLAHAFFIFISSSPAGIDRVAWNESIAFPTGPRVKKAYMSHTQAYPRQLYGTDNEWDICQVRRRSTRMRASRSSRIPLVRISPCRPIGLKREVVRVIWALHRCSVASLQSPKPTNLYQGFTLFIPRHLLYGVCCLRIYQQVSFLVSFFLVEASSQNSSALGFAVLEIPDDVRLSDGGAELSANVTSPQGQTLEDVVCVVDIKASGPPPRPPRDSDASHVDDDVSCHSPPLCRMHDSHKYELAVGQRPFLRVANPHLHRSTVRL